MKNEDTPNEEIRTVLDTRVMSFGLTNDENEVVRQCLPIKGQELFVVQEPVDLIAHSSSAIIIRGEALDEDSIEMFFSFYNEINECTDETVFWIGKPEPPKELKKVFKRYQSFDDLEIQLKYHLLAAHRKTKKIKVFSKQLAGSLKTLSLIRTKPGIKTSELAKALEEPERTILRYIAAMQSAGEWIEYDREKRGWYLQYGQSIFFDAVYDGHHWEKGGNEK